MRLLFDQNLPPRLLTMLADLVWQFAARLGFTIVSKDAHFHHADVLTFEDDEAAGFLAPR